jgi:uncharacterized protein (TIGR00251 family)
MLDLQSTPAGVILPVHAQPGARKNAVTGIHAGRLKVAVTQAPDKGKANQALVRLLAELLGVGPAQITLVAGATSRHKKFLVAGIGRADLEKRLVSLRGEPPAGTDR